MPIGLLEWFLNFLTLTVCGPTIDLLMIFSWGTYLHFGTSQRHIIKLPYSTDFSTVLGYEKWWRCFQTPFCVVLQLLDIHKVLLLPLVDLSLSLYIYLSHEVYQYGHSPFVVLSTVMNWSIYMVIVKNNIIKMKNNWYFQYALFIKRNLLPLLQN